MARQLKRGLNALLANIEDTRDEVKTEDKIYKVSVDLIERNPDQPRKSFNEESLKELSQSIRVNGIIQPIVVKKTGEKYLIIAGERRYRASILAGLNEVPVIIKDYDDLQIKEISLIENLQREDLNPIEEAMAIKELMEAYRYTQDDVAQKLGKSRPAVANAVRLLNLPEKAQEWVKNGALSAGHARAILSLATAAEQNALADSAAKEGWSVRETENRVRAMLAAKEINTASVARPGFSAEMKRFTGDLSNVFSTKVHLVGTETKGKICIDYADNETLVRICNLLESSKK